MTDDRLREIRDRQQAVNGLEWRVEDAWPGGDGPNIVKGYGEQYALVLRLPNPSDISYKKADFIAHAPADIDYLLAEVARLTSTVEAMRKNMGMVQPFTFTISELWTGKEQL